MVYSRWPPTAMQGRLARRPDINIALCINRVIGLDGFFIIETFFGHTASTEQGGSRTAPTAHRLICAQGVHEYGKIGIYRMFSSDKRLRTCFGMVVIMGRKKTCRMVISSVIKT